MKECDCFANSPRRMQICLGTSGLSLEKTNAYRESWGMSELLEVSEIEQPPQVPRKTSVPASKEKLSRDYQMQNKPKGTCGKCTAAANKMKRKMGIE